MLNAVRGGVRGAAHRIAASVPEPMRRRIRRWRRPAMLGTLRRTTPISERYGRDRGTPVDRYYVEAFLRAHRGDIRGHALEVMDSRYIDRFGRGITRRDVLDVDPTNPKATIVADLADATGIAGDQFDSIVLTQTLQYVREPAAAVRQLFRILAPGGVLLATLPGITRTARHEIDRDYWRFTPAACNALFGPVFGPEQIAVRSYGNVLAGIAFLTGMAREELRPRELDVEDPSFPVIVAIRATKPGTPAGTGRPSRGFG